jgi:hypothetical protein
LTGCATVAGVGRESVVREGGIYMDFSKLGQNEKLAVYGAAAVIIGGLVGYGYGMTILAVLAAIALLAVVFMPQLSPNTKLPGSHGSLMLLTGGVAGAVMLLALLVSLRFFGAFDFYDIFFVIAVIGGLLAAWAGWQAFQAEGGKFQLGASAGGSTTAAAGSAAPPPPAVAAPSDAPAAPAEPTAAPTSAEIPADPTDEGRPQA